MSSSSCETPRSPEPFFPQLLWFNHQLRRSPSSDPELQPLAAIGSWASSHPQCPQALVTHCALTHFSLPKLQPPCCPSQGHLRCSPSLRSVPQALPPPLPFPYPPTAQRSPAPSLLSVPLAWLPLGHTPPLLDPHLQPPVLCFVSSRPPPGGLRRSLYAQG